MHDHVNSMTDLRDKALDRYQINSKYYDMYNVKRGLRNRDGSGVMAGFTNISEVHGYVINEDEKHPMPGELIYRGYNIQDLIPNAGINKRYGFEENINLPTCEKNKDGLFVLRNILNNIKLFFNNVFKTSNSIK